MNPITTEDLARTVARARRRRLGQRLLLGFFVLMALGNLAFAGWQLFRGGLTAFELTLPLVLSTVSAVLVARLWQAAWREARHYSALTEPVAGALEQALAAGRARLAEYRRLFLILPGIVLPLFGLALWQLWAAGKMQPGDILSFALLLGVCLATALLVARHRIRYQLAPQIALLERQCAALREAG